MRIVIRCISGLVLTCGNMRLVGIICGMCWRAQITDCVVSCGVLRLRFIESVWWCGDFAVWSCFSMVSNCLVQRPCLADDPSLLGAQWEMPVNRRRLLCLNWSATVDRSQQELLKVDSRSTVDVDLCRDFEWKEMSECVILNMNAQVPRTQDPLEGMSNVWSSAGWWEHSVKLNV